MLQLGRADALGTLPTQHGLRIDGADVYTDAGAEGSLLDLGETTNDPLKDSNRWSLAITDTDAPDTDTDDPPGSDSPPEEYAGAADPPPDPGD